MKKNLIIGESPLYQELFKFNKLEPKNIYYIIQLIRLPSMVTLEY